MSPIVQLDARKQTVLRAVVEEHIRSAEPVGSEHLVGREQLRVSPATIRNVMAHLEDLGLLTHPHPSAGRVPTDRGYRYYVDALAGIEPLSQAERQAIRRRLAVPTGEPEDLADQAARVLASLTRYASVVTTRRLQPQTFRALHLIPADDGRVLAVVVTNTGALQGRLIDVPDGVRPEEMERIARAVTHRLSGMPIGDLSPGRLEQAIREVVSDLWVLDRLLTWLRLGPGRATRLRIHVEGARYLLAEPEFRRPETATRVLEALEEPTVVEDLLAHAPMEGLVILIGSEHRRSELRACSTVVATYRSGDAVQGAVALLGPTRLRYRHAVAAVRYVAGRLTEALAAQG